MKKKGKETTAYIIAFYTMLLCQPFNGKITSQEFGEQRIGYLLHYTCFQTNNKEKNNTGMASPIPYMNSLIYKLSATITCP